MKTSHRKRADHSDTHKIMGRMRNAAVEFAAADFDQDGELDRDEFATYVNALLSSGAPGGLPREIIDEWFESNDPTKSGTISMTEFFKFALNTSMGSRHGNPVERVLKRYDKDGSGKLSRSELRHALTKMGFGAMADDIFDTLDADRTGSVEVSEILNHLQQGDHISHSTSSLKAEFRGQISVSKKGKLRPGAPDRGWAFVGRSASAVRDELRAFLQADKVRAVEYFRELDISHDGRISRGEVRSWLRRVITRADDMPSAAWDELVDDLVTDMDSNASDIGSVNFEEFCAWLEYVAPERTCTTSPSQGGGAMEPPDGAHTPSLGRCPRGMGSSAAQPHAQQLMGGRCAASPLSQPSTPRSSPRGTTPTRPSSACDMSTAHLYWHGQPVWRPPGRRSAWALAPPRCGIQCSCCPPAAAPPPIGFWSRPHCAPGLSLVQASVWEVVGVAR